MSADFLVRPISQVIRQDGALAVIGTASALKARAADTLRSEPVAEMIQQLLPRVRTTDHAASTSTWLPTDPPMPAWLGVLPERTSRHNAPGRPDQVETLMREFLSRMSCIQGASPLNVLVFADDSEQTWAAALAIARAVPIFSQKTQVGTVRPVHLAIHCRGFVSPEPSALQVAADAVRQAARWHDMPPELMNPDVFVQTAQEIAKDVRAKCLLLRGPDLVQRGLGGLEAVGRCATIPPALVILSHEPSRASYGPTQTLAWVGKGITYDSGGLSLKTNAELAGMKGDMAGAGAVLAAFHAAIRLNTPHRIHAILCIAENAIGPAAVRVDDIIRPFSGKTVEVRNTDAEGRLVLADGVAYAAQELSPDTIVDLGTLTDAAVIATGRRHAAIVSNDEHLERSAILAGQATGELVHPLPYCPELLRPELESSVADLANVARDSQNANAGCAAQFICEHLGNYGGKWLHVDIEGPSRASNGRGTGFGVGLLLALSQSLR